ncbi:MAG: Translation initiation factor IF-2 [Candidatus Roizmanbacteria bacterium GW2011_GWA2_35_19]|uniref:Translation initiation factor IF-2 n=2 Tax=Candidatus Roizmaniibacteriota TaxID=1752723 RepID=A0A0G0EEW6_9BACT|nr:MAG: Translation initiation factor IF-2 [Candidatus Roizmanbacteria bacterium GW2011_GWC2_35_12]KKP73725.1 MAG: Translation initiation factor IF-2 [Candidatus Roizmanbacteria bacterium GW2011_GWA2_35_19]
MKTRPPIVTILGHVDHGKTTLLDYIRKSSIASKEHGGITQKIGAYEITTDFKEYKTNKITFIDTPGHEAFSRLRARGANIADIALLLIDGKDSLMPQTIESISHIKAASIPFIVVINKIDLPETNVEKVKNDLLKHEVQVESKGGNVPVAEVSAKTGKGIKELLETILFIVSDLKLEYEESNSPQAFIIETKKDRRGIMPSLIIKDGSIKVGDVLYCQDKKIKVRSLFNDLGLDIPRVIPSMPFEMSGFEGMPEVGAIVTDKKIEVVSKGPEASNSTLKMINLEDMLKMPSLEKKLSLIIKADSNGSLEAIKLSLSKNKNVDLVLDAVGEINKSDIFLAKTTKSIIIGFATVPSSEARNLAKQEKVIIKTYNIIYELLDELIEVADLLKEKEEKEKNLKGEAKVLATFIIEKETIYGVKITKGKINLGDSIEVFRNEKPYGKTKLISLKIRAKEISEVKKGSEAGMLFSPPLDITIGDMVKSIL